MGNYIKRVVMWEIARTQCLAISSQSAAIIAAFLMLVLLSACGPIQASRMEAMNSDERLALLQKRSTGKLCDAYLHPFVRDKTKAQVAEILYHRGINKCVVTGGSTIPVERAASAEATVNPEPYARPTITVEELRRDAERVRAYEPKDRLDFGPDFSSLVGKRFLIDIAARPRGPKNEICPGTPSWGYAIERSTLAISGGSTIFLGDYHKNGQRIYSGRQHLGYSLFSNLIGYSFDCQVSWGEPYVGNNAFGAKVKVLVRNERFISIVPEQPFGRIDADTWRGRISTQQARSLTGAARFRIQGRITEWSAGRPIICGTRTKEARLPAAIKENYNGCFVRAVIERVDLIDTRSNTVLRSRQPSKGWGRAQASTGTF